MRVIMNFLKYIELGTVGYETVTAFIALIAAKHDLTGVQITETVLPLVNTIQVTFNVTIPHALVADVANATATAINKYVFGK
jgi:hypothetical protein